MAQLAARVALRSQRPPSEVVDDEVEAALQAEALALHAATAHLGARLKAVEAQIAALEDAEAGIQENLGDKEASATVEWHVTAMDGRKDASVARPASVVSVSGAMGDMLGGIRRWGVIF